LKPEKYRVSTGKILLLISRLPDPNFRIARHTLRTPVLAQNHK
jgi:hypothetical protein